MERAETGQIVFEHEYVLEHEQAEAIMDTKSTEVKNTTNNLNNETCEFNETQPTCDCMSWAECEVIIQGGLLPHSATPPPHNYHTMVDILPQPKST
jgi:hypothetical protein